MGYLVADVAERITGLVKPYAYMLDVKVITNLGTARIEGIDVLCYLKVDRRPETFNNASPAEVRDVIFKSAQKVIAALEDAGFEHLHHPCIRIDGEVFRPLTTGPAQLVAQGEVTLHLEPPSE